MTLVALGNLILILEREVQPNLAPLRLHLFQLLLLGPALHSYPNSKKIIKMNIEQNQKVCASSEFFSHTVIVEDISRKTF